MRLSIREDGDLILLAADPLRVFAVTRQGHVRLPVGVRRWCGTGLPGVNTGDGHGELPRFAGAVVSCSW